jgi:ribosomal protein L29
MKYKDIQKLSENDLSKKLKELKIELVKSKIGVAKQEGSKTKKIRKIIARILTFNNQSKLEIETKT